MKLFTAVILTLASSLATAGPIDSGISFQGQIKKTNGQLLDQPGVIFKLSVLSPGSESCVLFEEQHVVNMSSNPGNFDLVLGQGSSNFAENKNPSPGLSLSKVFDNSTVKSNLEECASGNSYSPAASDIRKFKVSFNDGSTWTQLSAFSVHAAPYAEHAATLQGLTKDSFIKVNETSSAVSQNSIESVFSSSQMVQDLVALINGTSSKYLTSSPQGTVTFAAAPISSAQPATDTELANKLYVDNKVAAIVFPEQEVGIADVDGLTAALGSKLDYSAINTCATNQVAIFSSPSNTFECFAISTLPASAISSGQIAIARLPIGTTASSVAAGNDSRFGNAQTLQSVSVSSTAPTTGQVLTFNSVSNSWTPQSLPAQTAQVNSDWTASSGSSAILNKPTLGTAAALDVGTAANTVAAGNDSRFGAASSINSMPISATAPTVGQTLVFNGTSWVPSSTQGSEAPVGSIIAFSGTTCPTTEGYIAANGVAFAQATYPELFTVLGNSTTPPNLQGMFLRGKGSQTLNSVQYKSSDTLLGVQYDQMQGHYHSGYYASIGGTGAINGSGSIANSILASNSIRDATSDGTNGTPRTGTETRPTNVAVNYCIKAKSMAVSPTTVVSGTYSPTPVLNNFGGAMLRPLRYQRVGNFVTVLGSITVSSVGINGTAQATIAVPIAVGNFTTLDQCTGSTSQNGGGMERVGSIHSVVGTKNVIINFRTGPSSYADEQYINFTYEVP